jgi:hypothetical protein
MVEHGKRDRAKKGRAVVGTRRNAIPRNRPVGAMYCFMFHFDRIVPDLTDRKTQEISRISLN